MPIILSNEDTIAAISTPLGEGGIGVVRLSGGAAVSIADRIFKSRRGTPVRDQKSFTVQYGHAVSGAASGEISRVDEALLLLMRSPKSYTREDVVEISVHGGPAVLRAVLELALKAGARLAAPGEFTKRAFLNGRMDLLQAEAVSDLVRAKTELARQWAAGQLEGRLSEKIREIKKELVTTLSHLEASIDFPDDHLETSPVSAIESKLAGIGGRIRELLKHSEMGVLAKQGLKAVIIGRPNVGKSSIMNMLAKSNRVIVTSYPGTTRDTVEEEIQIKGFPVRLIDTAGIHESDHPIEREGIDRSRKAMQTADLLLVIFDGSQPFGKEDEGFLSALPDKRKIFVVNKTDLPKRLDYRPGPCDAVVETSCLNENGVMPLENEIFKVLTNGHPEISDEIVVSSLRQKELLGKTLESVELAREACHGALSPEFVALDVRTALDCLGQLAGEGITEDLLDSLFSQFCIGK